VLYSLLVTVSSPALVCSADTVLCSVMGAVRCCTVLRCQCSAIRCYAVLIRCYAVLCSAEMRCYAVYAVLRACCAVLCSAMRGAYARCWLINYAVLIRCYYAVLCSTARSAVQLYAMRCWLVLIRCYGVMQCCAVLSRCCAVLSDCYAVLCSVNTVLCELCSAMQCCAVLLRCYAGYGAGCLCSAMLFWCCSVLLICRSFCVRESPTLFSAVASSETFLLMYCAHEIVCSQYIIGAHWYDGSVNITVLKAFIIKCTYTHLRNPETAKFLARTYSRRDPAAG
jgi:hypothetical protein